MDSHKKGQQQDGQHGRLKSTLPGKETKQSPPPGKGFLHSRKQQPEEKIDERAKLQPSRREPAKTYDFQNDNKLPEFETGDLDETALSVLRAADKPSARHKPGAPPRPDLSGNPARDLNIDKSRTATGQTPRIPRIGPRVSIADTILGAAKKAVTESEMPDKTEPGNNSDLLKTNVILPGDLDPSATAELLSGKPNTLPQPASPAASGQTSPGGLLKPPAPAPKRPNLKRPPLVNQAEEELKRRAQPYDWGRTAKISPDQKKFLERVFRQFADYVTTKMAPLLQARLDINYQNVKLRSYSNFIQSIFEPVTLVVFKTDMDNRALIAMDFPFSFAIIERCIGGKGQPPEELKPLTEIESAVLERAISRIIESYQEAWGEIRECKAQFLEMQFNPQTVHIVKPSDMMICTTFELKLGLLQGTLNIGIPFDQIKSVLPKGNYEEFMLTRTSQTQSSPSVAPLFAKNLEQAKVPVSVELGVQELLFQDFLNIEIGDTIMLAQDINSPLRIKVNEKVKFLGRPGVKDKKMAVQITRVLQEGDEEYEE